MTSEIRANTLKNRVGLGTVSFTNTGPVVSGIVTANGLELNSVDTGSSADPVIKLYRNSASPADADYLGQLKFAGESDTGVERNYAKITGKILDASNGTEDGIIEFAHIKAGSQTITGRWRSDSLQLLNDTNLSVAGDTTLTGDLDVDGHTNLDNVSIAGVVTATTFSGSGASLTSIANANVSNSAAIAGSKIDPNFGTQTLRAGLGYFSNHLNTTGHFSMTGGSTQINFNRASHTPTYSLRLTGGSNPTMNFRIQDSTNSEDRFIIRHGGQIEIPGDVGIGHGVNYSTTNISKFGSYSTLHIKGPSNNGAAIRLQDNADTVDSDDFVIYKNYAAAYLRVNGTDPIIAYMNGADRLRITSNGNMGLGNDASFPIYTETNDRNFIIGTGSDDTAIQIHSGTSKYGGVYFGDSTSGGDRYVGYVEYKHNDNFLRIATANTERLRIDSSGRVMIGTTTQGDGLADNLTIADTGNCGLTIKAGSSSLSSIFFADGTGANAYIGQQVYNHSDNSLKWIVNGSEALRINSQGQIQKRQDSVNRSSLKTYSGEGLWFDHYQYQSGSTYRRYADIVSVGDGSWGSYMRFFTMKDGGTPAERLTIQKDGGVYMRTQGGFTNEAGNLSSGVGYDNRTRLYPYWVSETGACRFHFSATANSGISQPRFWLFTNGTNHLTGKIEIGMNQRTNSPVNARFRNHQSTWQVAMYGEGDNDGSGMRYNHLVGTQRGSTTVSTFDEYYVSSNGSSHYGTNDNQYQDGYGGWYWKMDGGSGVQGHRFHFDCYFSGGGFSTWYMYIDQ